MRNDNTNKPRKKPGRKPGSTFIDEEDRMVNVTVRLPRKLRDRLKKLGNITLLCRDAVEDKYGR